jgi:GAF domain-containing protein
LRALNSRSPHRFTGVYRFDPPMLRNLHLYDAFAPNVTRCDDSRISESYCAIVHSERRSLGVENSLTDPRLARHPAREIVISYCGVLIRDDRGAPFGTICHFDSKPCEVSTSELALMEQLAPYVHEAIFATEHGREAR